MIWRTLKYLADENIDPEVIDFFVKDGYDFRNVFQEQLQSTDDKAIIQKAKTLDRIIITHDTDFGHIIFTERVPFTGIIYLQPGHIEARFTIQTLQQLFNSDIELVQPFIVVTEHKGIEIKIRVRNSILLK